MPAEATEPAAGYCLEQVRRFDRDRYLTALFAPADRRDDLLALYAFSLEVARIRELIREPMMGRIRLQWWRDAVAEIYAGNERRHQVVQPLATAVRRHGLARAPLDRLIDAREADMEETSPADLPALIAYADATAAGLGLLALRVLDGEEKSPAADVVRAVWLAAALTGLLRAIPFQARRRRIQLPQTLMAAHGVAARDLLELRHPPALPAAVRVIAQEARRRLDSARPAATALPRRLMPALLPGTLTALYLRRLERSGYDVFAPAVQQAPPARVWRLLLASLRGRF
ncbi:MAG: phytoene/squalene synthase family protein [Dongiaceae bacterium]